MKLYHGGIEVVEFPEIANPTALLIMAADFTRPLTMIRPYSGQGVA